MEAYAEALAQRAKELNISGVTEDDAHQAAEAFAKLDRDKSDTIDVSELKQALTDAGVKITGFEVREVLQKWQRSGTDITFNEFVTKFAELRAERDSGRKFNDQIETKAGLKHLGKGSMKSYHSYAIEERIGVADWCNRVLKGDKDMKHILPIDLDTEDLFLKAKDGILFCKLINSAISDTIDERSINKIKEGKTEVDTFRQTENLNLALNSAKSIGATVINVGSQDILDGRGHLILGLMWQIIEIGLMAGVTLENNPHIAALLEPDEELSDLQRLSAEDILLRWVNFHLRNDKTYDGPHITNFKNDIKDSIAYIHLLAQIQPEDHMPRISSDHTAADNTARAEKVLKHAEYLGCRAFVQPRDIVEGKEKLNLAFVANLFNNHPALHADNIEIIEETREEKTYRNWMNSLGVVNPRIIRIYSDLKSGVALYDVMAKIDPDLVKNSKSKVVRPPFKKINATVTQRSNLQEVVNLGKEMGFKLTGIAGQDIYDENSKLTLALLWQMMRAYSVKVLKDLGDGSPVTDKDILDWANSKLGENKISSFKDPDITTSKPIYRLINAYAANTIDFSVVNTKRHDMMSAEDKRNNARYALSQARKLGATVYALPDDITEGNQKMVTTVFASLMILDKVKK